MQRFHCKVWPCDLVNGQHFSKANLSSLIMGRFYSFCKGMKNSGYEITMAIITFYFVRKMMVEATNEFVVNP